MFKGISIMKRRQIVYGVIAIAWMVMIFLFSAQNGTSSGGTSQRILEWLGALLNMDMTANLEVFQFILRKGAHAFEYFMLAIWLYLCFFHSKHQKHAIWIAILGSFLYACSDEFHQLFIDNRSGQFKDVLIDTSGAILAMVTFRYLHLYYVRKAKRLT